MLLKHENAHKQRGLTMVRMRPLDVSIVGQDSNKTEHPMMPYT